MNRLLRGVGMPIPERSAYDRFMLGFHDYLKFNADYQRTCAKYRFEFPPTPPGWFSPTSSRTRSCQANTPWSRR